MAVKTKHGSDDTDYRDYDPKKKEDVSTSRKKLRDLVDSFDRSYMRGRKA